MNGLLRSALAITGIEALAETAQAKARHLMVGAVCGAIAAILVIAALIWFDIALFFYCAPRLGPGIAALISGGALIVVALLALVPMAIHSRPPRPLSPPVSNPVAGIAVADLAGRAVHEANTLFREHKGTVIVAAALAGLVLSARDRRH